MPKYPLLLTFTPDSSPPPRISIEPPMVLFLDEMGHYCPPMASAASLIGATLAATPIVLAPNPLSIISTKFIEVALSGIPIHSGTWHASTDEGWSKLLQDILPPAFTLSTVSIRYEDEDGVGLLLGFEDKISPHHLEHCLECSDGAPGLTATCLAAQPHLAHEPDSAPLVQVSNEDMVKHMHSIGTGKVRVATLRQIKEAFKEIRSPVMC